MSSRLSSRYCWQKFHLRRLYSSAVAETSQSSRHAPIASDLGGIQIGAPGSRMPRQRTHSGPLDLRDFKHGTLAEKLAIRQLQQQQPSQDPQPQNPTTRNPIPSQSQSSQPNNANLSSQKDDAYVRPRQERRSMDTRQNYRSPGQQGSKMQRRSRPVEREVEMDAEMELYEEDDTDAIDDDVNATKTTFWLRRPDPLLPPSEPRLPPSLTMLEQKIYIDTPTHKLLEQHGGDYVRYFSPDEWKIAHAQSSAPVSVVDYARLTLHLNKMVPIPQRDEGVEIVRKHAERAKTITATT